MNSSRATISYEHRQAENDPGILFSTTGDSYYLGLCTGGLPAAAAAAVESVDQLVQIAPAIVCVSARLAMEARRRSSNIDRSTESWAVVVSGENLVYDLQQAIDEYHKQYVSISGFAWLCD